MKRLLCFVFVIYVTVISVSAQDSENKHHRKSPADPYYIYQIPRLEVRDLHIRGSSDSALREARSTARRASSEARQAARRARQEALRAEKALSESQKDLKESQDFNDYLFWGILTAIIAIVVIATIWTIWSRKLSQDELSIGGHKSMRQAKPNLVKTPRLVPPNGRRRMFLSDPEVPLGFVGVMVKRGIGLTQAILLQGFHKVGLGDTLILIESRLQSSEWKFGILSCEGATVSFSIIIAYQLEWESAPSLGILLGGPLEKYSYNIRRVTYKDYEERLFHPQLKARLNRLISKKSIVAFRQRDIATEKEGPIIIEIVKDVVEKYGFKVSECSVDFAIPFQLADRLAGQAERTLALEATGREAELRKQELAVQRDSLRLDKQHESEDAKFLTEQQTELKEYRILTEAKARKTEIMTEAELERIASQEDAETKAQIERFGLEANLKLAGLRTETENLIKTAENMLARLSGFTQAEIKQAMYKAEEPTEGELKMAEIKAQAQAHDKLIAILEGLVSRLSSEQIIIENNRSKH